MRHNQMILSVVAILALVNHETICAQSGSSSRKLHEVSESSILMPSHLRSPELGKAIPKTGTFGRSTSSSSSGFGLINFKMADLEGVRLKGSQTQRLTISDPLDIKYSSLSGKSDWPKFSHIGSNSTGVVSRVNMLQILKIPEVGVGATRHVRRQHCNTSADCPRDTNGLSGHCLDGWCTCLSGYTQTYEGCSQTEGRECDTSVECGAVYSLVGGTGECQGRLCVCKSGYKPTPLGCEEIPVDQNVEGEYSISRNVYDNDDEDPSSLGYRCVYHSDCPDLAGYSGWCDDGECECHAHYFKRWYQCTGGAPTSAAGASLLVVIATVVSSRFAVM